uniref:hypothetical protein n=1 Tax=Parerythrobacter lutipelagi TaxID=1964208 RepID=UPI001F01934C|nr:hypothetical protein [Parerythrobacter lutipelagi]
MPQLMTLRRNLPKIAVSLFSLAAMCCTPVPEAAPPVVTVPMPVPTPTVAPPTLSEPVYENYLDAPQTPGDWTYSRDAGETLALFASGGNRPEFIVRCNLRSRQVGLGRAGVAEVPVPMRIRTETEERLMSASPVNPGRALVVTELTATDPLLDAIAFSRGRFAVETAGLRTLYLPAWPEITRVIEDCR